MGRAHENARRTTSGGRQSFSVARVSRRHESSSDDPDALYPRYFAFLPLGAAASIFCAVPESGLMVTFCPGLRSASLAAVPSTVMTVLSSVSMVISLGSDFLPAE